ncbi:MAG: hypothetical protein RL077_4062, partial [Verrucomicrobiota bacterium]
RPRWAVGGRGPRGGEPRNWGRKKIAAGGDLWWRAEGGRRRAGGRRAGGGGWRRRTAGPTICRLSSLISTITNSTARRNVRGDRFSLRRHGFLPSEGQPVRLAPRQGFGLVAIGHGATRDDRTRAGRVGQPFRRFAISPARAELLWPAAAAKPRGAREPGAPRGPNRRGRPVTCYEGEGA